MTRLRGHQFLLVPGLLAPASGFGIPSPADMHSVATALGSLHEQSIHLFNNDFPRAHEAMDIPIATQIKDHFTNDIRELYAAIKQATVTKRVDNALAGVLAEAAAGATGALISRKTSTTMIGGKKRDSLGTKMKTTSAFFGARIGAEGDIHLNYTINAAICKAKTSLVQYYLSGVTRVLGIPKPLSLLLATIVGSFFSTSVKVEGRIADQDVAKAQLFSSNRSKGILTAADFDTHTNTPNLVPTGKSLPWSGYYLGDGEFLVNMDPPPKRIQHASFAAVPTKDQMSFSEIAGDIGKWMVYDNLVVNSGLSTGLVDWTDYDKTALHVLFGAIAAVSGKYIQDLTPSKDKVAATDCNAQYTQRALEGGVLFGTYKSTLTFLNSVVPEEWNKVFPFETALENVESMIP